MDENTIMKMETIEKEPKKEPKKECEETSKTLLKTLEQEEIEKSPYEKAKERYRIAWYEDEKKLIFVHLEQAFQTKRLNRKTLDSVIKACPLTQNEITLGKLSQDEEFVLYYCECRKKEIQGSLEQGALIAISIILCLEDICKKNFLKRIGKEDISASELKLKREKDSLFYVE